MTRNDFLFSSALKYELSEHLLSLLHLHYPTLGKGDGGGGGLHICTLRIFVSIDGMRAVSDSRRAYSAHVTGKNTKPTHPTRRRGL